MKHIVEVRSNKYLSVHQTDKEFELKPIIEIIIIHTDGKKYGYNQKKDSVISELTFHETRFLAEPQSIDTLIAQLQLFQREFNSLKHNSALLNEISKSIIKDQLENKTTNP